MQRRDAFLALGSTCAVLVASGPVGLVRAAAAADATGIPSNRIDWRRAPERLMMVEARGCRNCAAWRREIGPAYGRSREGSAAPLLVVDIDGPWPDGLVLGRRPAVTPTFVLLRRGSELARLEGYPGNLRFYPLLSNMLAGAGIDSL